MATITTRAGKGSPLTNTEVDNNFTNINTELGQKESASNKGVANGYASLDGSGKVPSTQLPSYVDDVVEGANLAALPATGETGKIYVTLDTNKTYRWSGSAYVEISASPGSTDAVTEGSTNLYFTNARARSAISATGSLSYNSSTGVMSFTDAVTSVAGKTGSVTLTNSDVGLGNVENKSSATIRGELTSGNVTTALGFTPYNSSNPSGYITSSSLSSYLPLSGGTLTGQLTTSYSGARHIITDGTNSLNMGLWDGSNIRFEGSGRPMYFVSYGGTISLGRSSGSNLVIDNTSVAFGGNTLLHAANYTSYSPSLVGSGASGTWPISVTGNANTASLAIWSNQYNFTTAGAGWYRVATTGSDGRGTYNVELYCTGGSHNPALLQICAQGDWGYDKVVYANWDGNFPASSVRITRGASNTFLEVYFTTAIVGATLRVNRSGFDTTITPYTGSLPAGGDTVQDTLPLVAKINASGVYSSGQSRFGNILVGNGTWKNVITPIDDTNLSILTPSGGLYTTNIFINSNQVLHAGNYSSYALPLSGGTLTGSPTISGNGNGLYFTGGNNRIYFGGSYRAMEGNGNGTQLQIGEGYSATYLQSANNYATTSNHLILHAGNYSSYSLPLSGGTITGSLTVNNSLSFGGFSQNLPESGLWSYITSYAYDPVNSTRWYWHKLCNLPETGFALIEYHAKDDSNYPRSVRGYIDVASYNNSSVSIKHDAIIGFNGSQPQVRIDNNNDVWLRFPDITWNSYTAWRVLHRQAVTFYRNETKQFDTPANSIELLPGQQVRATRGSVTGASVENTTTYAGYLYSRSNAQIDGYIGIGQGPNSSYRVITNGHVYANSGGNVYAEGRHYSRHGTGTFYESLTTGNYSSYALPLSGGTISGTVSINGGGSQPLNLTTSGSGPWGFGLTRSDAGVSSRVFLHNGSGSWTWVYEHNPVFYNGGAYNPFLHSGNYSSYALPLSGGTLTGVVNSIDFRSQGQIRATGWYNNNSGTYTGLGTEIGVSGGGSYILSYNRDTGSYGTLEFNATAIRLVPISGGSVTGPSGNVILHAGNYTSYSPSLTGSGASGTWGINITGNADTVDSLHASSFSRKDATNQWIKPYYEYGSYLTGETPANLRDQMGGGGLRVDFLHPSYTGSGGWNHVITWSGYNLYNMYQLGGHYDGGTGTDLWVRSEANHGGTSWTAWRKLLNSSNYNSYSPTLTGGGASGTWGISISGTATYATNVSNGRFDNYSGSYNNAYTWIQFGSSGGYGLYFPGSGAGTHFFPQGNTYGSFKVEGYRNTYSGLFYDTHSGTNAGWMTNGNASGFYTHGYGWKYLHESGVFYIYSGTYGGGSGYIALHSGNYTSYSPSLTGSGASGSWNITAARATRANGNFYIDDNYGNGIVGVYTSTRYQGVFAMGDSYKLPADGSSTGSLYGMAWSHPNAGGVAGNLDSHGMLVLINGGFGSCMSYSIRASGNVTAYSDERLKTNWRPMPTNYVERLASVKVGIYDRTDGEQMTQVGVSAQSFQELLPEAITKAGDEMGTLSVAYGNAAMASAVELAKEIVNLKREIEMLKTKLH